MTFEELEKRVSMLETQNEKLIEAIAYLLVADTLSQEVCTNLSIIVTGIHSRINHLESEVAREG